MMPGAPTEAEMAECTCMAADLRILVERHAAMGLPTCVPEQLRGHVPAVCICMKPEVRSFLEACAEYMAACPEYNSHSDNGQSPASMDLSDNLTPSSSSGNPGGSTASYSPLNFNEPGPLQYEPPKEGGWELLDFGAGDYYLDGAR